MKEVIHIILVICFILMVMCVGAYQCLNMVYSFGIANVDTSTDIRHALLCASYLLTAICIVLWMIGKKIKE